MLILRQHLATKTNDIPLTDIRFSTEHTEQAGVISHVGWKIKARYSGPDKKKEKQEYELIFSPELAEEFRDKLTAMLERFKNGDFVQEVLGRREAEAVAEDE